jgi:hypothetical protein
VPELLPNGQVKVDMGQPILEGPRIPTTLAPTQGSTVLEQVSQSRPGLICHAHDRLVTIQSVSSECSIYRLPWLASISV